MAVIFPAEHLLGTAATLGVLQCTAVLLAPLHAALAANALQLLQRQWQGQEQSAEANGVGGVALDYIEQARSSSRALLTTFTTMAILALTITLTPLHATLTLTVLAHYP